MNIKAEKKGSSELKQNTLIIQSHKNPLPYEFLTACLESVRYWCDLNNFEYRFLSDELFDLVPAKLMQKTGAQIVIATDLARLLVVQEALKQGYTTVVWLDADFLIFNPEAFVLPASSYAVGREVWVQENEKGKLKVYKKVHNAFLMFKQGNSFLDFYIETSEKLLHENSGTMPPQYIGPKLLTALHNIAQLPVLETAGMLSPLVMKDILHGGGNALDLFIKNSPNQLAGVNLCGSSVASGDINNEEMAHLIRILEVSGILITK